MRLRKNMKWMIDANILLDVLQERKPFCEDASRIWKMCEVGLVEGYVSTLSFANIVYIMRKEMDAKKMQNVLHALSLIFTFESLTERDLMKAAQTGWDDYEDAIQFAIASRIKADYIITRNGRDYGKGHIAAVAPSYFSGD